MTMSTHFKTIIFVLGVSLGIVIGHVSLFATEIAVGALIIFIGQGIIYMTERKRKATGFALSLATMLLASGVVLGVIRVQLVQEKVAYTCDGICTLEAKIISSPQIKDTYQVISIRPLESNSDMFDVQIRVPLYPRYAIGETVRLSGKVTTPTVLPPHGDAKSFDYGAYLATKNIGSEMMFPKVEVLDTDAHTVSEYLGRWKGNLISRSEHFISSPASALASGMLFGNSSMSKEVTDMFRIAGLSHIVVLSGFNIAIVIASILFVFAFIPLIARILLASFFVIMFVLMVGVEASVLRATAMAFIALLSTLAGRAYVAKQALILSLLTIIFYSPNSLLHDVSLHLSFLATAGIVYASGTLRKIIERYSSRPSFTELATTTCAAYLATLPYVCYTFGTVSMYALLSNLITLPFVPLAMLMSFITVCLSYISETLALGAGYIDTLILNFILAIARLANTLPFSSISFSLSLIGMCVMYCAFIILAVVLFYKKENETVVTMENGHLTGIIKY